MKSVDKIIIRTLIGIVTIALIICLYIDYRTTFRVIACLGGIGYLFFVMSHLALCFPIVVIFIVANDIINQTYVATISIILHNMLVAILGIFFCFIIYFIGPLILITMYNGTINLSINMQTFAEIINH